MDGNRKRSVSNEDGTDTGADEEARVAKRAKKVKGLAPPTMRLALSGYKRWIGAKKTESEERVSTFVLQIHLVSLTTLSHDFVN